MTHDQTILDFILKYWVIIGAFVAFFVGYVELRVKVMSHGKRLDTMEAHMREDLREIRDDIKELLKR